MSKHVGEKCGNGRTETGRTESRTDGWTDGDPDGHHHTIMRPVWRRAYKNWRKLMTLELDLKYSKTKSNAKFQLNMSKRVREKCGKLCTFSILSSIRGITPTKIDGNWRHSNLICSTVKQSDMQNFNLICQSMYEKSVENCTLPIF